MVLAEINGKLNKLKKTRESLILARKKFESKDNQENYLNYFNLTTAIECVENEIERIETKDWN